MSCWRWCVRGFWFQAWLLSGYLNAQDLTGPNSAAPTPAPDSYGTEGEYQNLVNRVTQADAAEYQLILHEYDEYRERHPADVTARVEKCRFIGEFVDSDDTKIESAEDDAGRCEDALRTPGLERDGEVQVFLLEQLDGQALLEAARKLVPISHEWTPALRARLYERLADALESSKPEAAVNYLARAVKSDPLSTRRLALARHLKSRGNTREALEILRTTPTEAWERLSIDDAARLFIDLGAPEEAASLIRAHPPGNDSGYWALELAHRLAESRQTAAARELYDRAFKLENRRWPQLDLAHYFEFELKHGTRQQAEAAYRRLRDSGEQTDRWGRYRLALFMHYPGVPWYTEDSGVLRMLALLVIVALLPGLLVVAIHYRYLAKRVRGFSAAPGRWGLRSIWYALAIIGVASTVSCYLAAYETFANLMVRFSDHRQVGGSEDIDLGRMLILQSAIMVVLSLPLLRGAPLRELFLGRVAVKISMGWGLLTGFGCAALAFLYGLAITRFHHPAAVTNLVNQALSGIHSAYGIGAELALAAVLVPIIEETLFRGVILQSLSRYMRYRWAAVLQAGLFASMHQSFQALPYIFVLGLLTAWLVRRTGGLLAPMMLHGFNNAMVIGAIALSSTTIGSGH